MTETKKRFSDILQIESEHSFKTLWKKFQVPLLISIVAGLLVQFTLYSNGLMSPDGIWHGEHSVSGTWEVSLGRWAIFFVEKLRWEVNSPILGAVLAISLTAVAGIIMAELFQIKSRLQTTLLACSLTCSPMMAAFVSYFYCADAYALSILLAVLAVYLTVFFVNKYLGVTLGIFCIAVSNGIYQSSLGVMLAVSSGYILIRLLLQVEESKKTLTDFAKLLIVFVGGCLLYYGLTQIALAVWNTTLSSYKGADSFGFMHIVQNLFISIKAAYNSFLAFFREDWIAKNYYGEGSIYLILLALGLLSLLIRLRKLNKHPFSILGCILIVITFPICCNIIQIIIPKTEFTLLMVAGMMVTVPLLLAIINSNNKYRFKETDEFSSEFKKKGLLNKMAAVMLVALLWSYVLTTQTDAQVMLESKNRTIQFANRVWEKIESHENYMNDETSILFAGTLELGNYPNTSSLYEKSNIYARYGLVWSYSYDGNIETWHEVFRIYLGVDYNKITPQQYEKIVQTKEFKDMPIYPAEGSIKVISNVLVIKLSEITGWQ